VPDPEEVPWAPLDPSIEGLLSKIVCANVLHTLHPHWSYAEAPHLSFTVKKTLLILCFFSYLVYLNLQGKLFYKAT